MACFVTAVHTGETVAILGCGGVGLAAVCGAALAGAGRIIAVDRQPSKLELARRFGATDLVDASSSDVVTQIVELTRGGVHHAIEAVGLKVTAEQAFAMLRRGGTATITGMIPVGTMLQLHGADFLAERKIQGSLMGSNRFPVDMPRFVDFYMSGRLDLDAMISRRIRLEHVNEAMTELRCGELARSIIMFE